MPGKEKAMVPMFLKDFVARKGGEKGGGGGS
jgi:hypothetical protein